MDGTFFIGLLSRVAHISSAIIMVGGLFYLRTIVANALSSEEIKSDSNAEAFYGPARKRWALTVMVTTLFLIVSGLYNFISITKSYEVVSKYHMLFGIKFLSAGLIFFIAAIIAGKTSAATRFRKSCKLWLNVALAASLVIVILAAMMRTEQFRGEKKSAETASIENSLEI